MAYIYKISNNINDKVYIGKTNNSIKRRFMEHIRDSKKEYAKNRPLYNAINKYGEENFYIEEIEECSEKDAFEKEVFWIDFYNSYKNGYNATYGGDGKLRIDYDEVINLYRKEKSQIKVAELLNINVHTVYKILKCRKEQRLSPREVAEQSNVLVPVNAYDKETGKFIESFDCISDAARWLIETNSVEDKDPYSYTRHISEVIHNKNRKSAYGFLWSTEKEKQIDVPKIKNTGSGKRKVQMLDKDTKKILKEFESNSEAARFLGDVKKNSKISACALGKQKTAYGYVWQYV